MADPDLRRLMLTLFGAFATVSAALRAELVVKAEEQKSVFGDVQLGVDVVADDLMWDVCKTTPLVKEGASEDHAILQCNLFLGLGIDAYLAIGRLPGGVTQHVWVVTREPNGDVLFWEPTKGDYYTLPGRWTGLYLDGASGAAGVEGGGAAADVGGDCTAARTPLRPPRRSLAPPWTTPITSTLSSPMATCSRSP